MAWLAYKHPVGFRPIGLGAMILSGVAFICVIAYDIGAQAISSTVSEYIDPARLADAHRAETTVRPNMIITAAIFLGIHLYLGFLFALPVILGLGGQDEAKHKRDQAD
jgi:hypothetical protein